MNRLEGHRPGLCRRWRHPVLVAALLGPVLLGACGSDLGASGPVSPHQVRGGVGGAAAADAVGADVTTPSAQVMAAWLAAERAFETAGRTANPQEPDLVATTAEPLIGVAEGVLQRMRASGEVARGQMRFGSSEATVVSPQLALVHACGHDDEVNVFVSTGRPVPGILGEFANERIVSKMQLTATGWKLADQTVQVAPCE